MIKPSELRVGNLFHPTTYSNGIRVPQSTIAKIITIDAFHALWLPYDWNPAQVDKWNESKYGEIEPIPLTSEWLLKFGFKVQSITWYDGSVTHGAYVKNDYYIEENDYPGEFFICKIDNEFPGYRNVLIRTVQYVDQLQNAFYFITGEELTIQ